MRFLLHLLVTFILLAAALPAHAALIIGNSNYADPRLRLANPRNDAAAMKVALTQAGFETIIDLDAKRVE